MRGHSGEEEVGVGHFCNMMEWGVLAFRYLSLRESQSFDSVVLLHFRIRGCGEATLIRRTRICKIQ
jgi:hypothetical protein